MRMSISSEKTSNYLIKSAYSWRWTNRHLVMPGQYQACHIDEQAPLAPRMLWHLNICQANWMTGSDSLPAPWAIGGHSVISNLSLLLVMSGCGHAHNLLCVQYNISRCIIPTLTVSCCSHSFGFRISTSNSIILLLTSGVKLISYIYYYEQHAGCCH